MLTEVVPNSDNSLGTTILKNVCQLETVSNPQTGGITVAIAPYALFAEGNTITIRNDAIVFTCEPPVPLINQYNQIFGTGLILPEKNITTGVIHQIPPR